MHAQTVVKFTVPGIPAPAGSKNGFYNRKQGRVIITDDSYRAKPWMAAVAAAAHEAHAGELLAGPLELQVHFVLPRPAGHFGKGVNAEVIRPGAPTHPTVRPDITKLVRAVEDALTGIIWRDDAQVVVQHLTKTYGHRAECLIAVTSPPRAT